MSFHPTSPWCIYKKVYSTRSTAWPEDSPTQTHCSHLQTTLQWSLSRNFAWSIYISLRKGSEASLGIIDKLYTIDRKFKTISWIIRIHRNWEYLIFKFHCSSKVCDISPTNIQEYYIHCLDIQLFFYKNRHPRKNIICWINKKQLAWTFNLLPPRTLNQKMRQTLLNTNIKDTLNML